MPNTQTDGALAWASVVFAHVENIGCALSASDKWNYSTLLNRTFRDSSR